MKSLVKFSAFFIFLIGPVSSVWAASSVVEIKTPTLHMIFTTGAISSLVYQIDCMSDVIRCESKTIQDFWKTQKWSEQDEKALQNWAAIMNRYRESQFKIDEFEPGLAKDVGFPLRNNSISFDKKVRMASFISNDIQSYRDSLSLLMQAPDVEQALAVVQHFYSRHQTWWKKEGERKTKAFTQDFVQVMKKKSLTTFLPQVAAFYQAHISVQTPVYFHFFQLPGKTKQSSGEQVENHSVVEIPDGETAAERVDVILHELSHYLYRLSPVDKHIQLVKSFTANTDASSIPAYNLLNEVLATAIGNGLINQKVMTPERYKKYFEKKNSFYNDAAIDQVSKQLMPKIDEMLRKGESLYEPDFTTIYIQLVKTTLGDMALMPKLILRSMVILHQGEFKKDLERFARNIRNGAYWSSTDFKSLEHKARLMNNAHLSGVIMVRPEGLELLETWTDAIPTGELKKIRTLAKQTKPLIHPIQRTANSWIYVIVASPGEEATAALAKLENATSPTEFK